MRIPWIWDTRRDKIAFIVFVVIPIVFALLISFSGCTIEKKQDTSVVLVDKHDLYELTYEWAMYKEIAIVAYAQIHECSKEDAAAHLDNSIKYSNTKKFIADVEFNEKWERKQ